LLIKSAWDYRDRVKVKLLEKNVLAEGVWAGALSKRVI